MTKNVDTPPISIKRARLQFTIAELLLFKGMTFLGIGLVVREFGAISSVLVIISSIIGARIGLGRCETHAHRKVRLASGIVFGWLLAALSYRVFDLMVIRGREDDAFVLALLCLPVVALFMWLFLRAASKPENVLSTFTTTTIVLVLVYGMLFTILAPQYIYRRCPPCTAAAAACKAYAEAQEIYHRTDYSGAGLQYATTLQALVGRHGELALIDKTFAQAEIGTNGMAPKTGYYFKILTAQGPNATGGRRSYIDASGQMTLGYAIVAMPSKWDETGRDCYMINNNGTIYQQDLGPNTPFLAASMTEFDPDTNWVPTQ